MGVSKKWAEPLNRGRPGGGQEISAVLSHGSIQRLILSSHRYDLSRSQSPPSSAGSILPSQRCHSLRLVCVCACVEGGEEEEEGINKATKWKLFMLTIAML